MSCICPICKQYSSKHNIYGIKLTADCVLCLSSNTYDEKDENGIIITDENLKLESLTCGHVFHNGCIKRLIEHNSIFNSEIDSLISYTDDSASDIPTPTPTPTPIRTRNPGRVWRARTQSSSISTFTQNDLPPGISISILNIPFSYCNTTCEWALGTSGNIVLYETGTYEPFQGGSYRYNPRHPPNTIPRWIWIERRYNIGKWILISNRRIHL
jgi:hypothetical protein